MADDTIPHADPPLVLKAEDAPLVISVTPKPHPGLLEAILWGVIFLLTQLIALIGIATFAFGVFAIQERDPAAFVNDQLDKVAKATGDQPEQTDKPEFPNELGQALAYGMLGAQFASLILILVVLPWRIGKDWKREIAIRMPSVLHLFLIVLITPGFMLLTSGIEELLQ